MNESDMESAIDLPNFPNICRICLESEGLQLFCEDYLMDVFKTITSIEVENDGFPLYICKVCLQKLEEITDFGDMARYNNTEYKKTWSRRIKLKGDPILNEQNHAVLVNNQSRMTEPLLNNHSRMKEDAHPNNHSKMTTTATPSNIYSEKKYEEVVLETDNKMTNGAVISSDHFEPAIKAEIFSMDGEITKEEVLLETDSEINDAKIVKVEPSNTYSEKTNKEALPNAHNLMTIALLNNQGEATVKVELSNFNSESTSEAVLLNTHSEVTNELILMNKQGSKTQAAAFFSSLYESTCSSNSMDQNSEVVTITDTESETESRDLSFISHLQVGNVNFREDPDRHHNPDKSRKPRHRHVYTRYEILELEKEFVIDPFPSGLRRAEIAAALGISAVQVKVWFQNRRMKLRKEEEKIKRENHEKWKQKMILDRLQGMEPQNRQNFNAF